MNSNFQVQAVKNLGGGIEARQTRTITVTTSEVATVFSFAALDTGLITVSGFVTAETPTAIAYGGSTSVMVTSCVIGSY